jgi:hypothetical protein
VRTLCLSGGGFRATIFHAGAIAALRALNLLRSIDNIVSVSGGSITAAHVVINWEAYNDLDADGFLEQLRELLNFVSSDIRGRIVRRWLLLGLVPRFHRIQQLIRHYDDMCTGALGKLRSHICRLPNRSQRHSAYVSRVRNERVEPRMNPTSSRNRNGSTSTRSVESTRTGNLRPIRH